LDKNSIIFYNKLTEKSGTI